MIEQIDWRNYTGANVDFIDPNRTRQGWNYNGTLLRVDPEEGVPEYVVVRDSKGEDIEIPVRMAVMNILIIEMRGTRPINEILD